MLSAGDLGFVGLENSRLANAVGIRARRAALDEEMQHDIEEDDDEDDLEDEDSDSDSDSDEMQEDDELLDSDHEQRGAGNFNRFS